MTERLQQRKNRMPLAFVSALAGTGLAGFGFSVVDNIVSLGNLPFGITHPELATASIVGGAVLYALALSIPIRELGQMSKQLRVQKSDKVSIDDLIRSGGLLAPLAFSGILFADDVLAQKYRLKARYGK